MARYDKIIAKIVPRSCQDLTKIFMEGQRGNKKMFSEGVITCPLQVLGYCDMTSYYVLIYIYAKNSSTDNLVPVNSTTIQHTHADLFT